MPNDLLICCASLLFTVACSGASNAGTTQATGSGGSTSGTASGGGPSGGTGGGSRGGDSSGGLLGANSGGAGANGPGHDAGEPARGGAGGHGTRDGAVDAGSSLDAASPIPPFDPPTCGPPIAGFSGALCGPANNACRVLADEVVDAASAFRNRAPAIAADPAGRAHLLYYVAVGGYSGFYGTRADTGVWSKEPFPKPVADGNLVIGPDGSPVALVNDGTIPGTSLWKRGALGWARLDGNDLNGYEAYQQQSLIATSDGCFNAAFVDANSYPAYGLWNGHWNLSSLGYSSRGGMAPGIALDAAGDVNLAAWKYDASAAGSVEWLRRSMPAEPVDVPNGIGDVTQTFITVASSGETSAPAVLYRGLPRSNADPMTLSNLIEARRLPGGGWDHQIIASSTGLTSSGCGQATPTSPDCNVDFTDVAPVGIVSSGDGSVRTFFTTTHQTARLVASCMQLPGGNCTFNRVSGKSDAQLEMAWRNADGSVGRSVIARASPSDDGGIAASVTTDVQGRIHAGWFDGHSSSTVRYLLLGP